MLLWLSVLGNGFQTLGSNVLRALASQRAGLHKLYLLVHLKPTVKAKSVAQLPHGSSGYSVAA